MPKIGLRFACTSFSVFALAACGVSGTNGQTEETTVTISTIGPDGMLVLSCSGCHASKDGAIASLTAYDESSLKQALITYKSESAGTTVMHRLARGYSDAEIDLIAAELSQVEDVR